MIDAKQIPLGRNASAASKASAGALLKMRVNTPDPVWSSSVLTQYVNSILSSPEGALEDVLYPTAVLIGESNVILSDALSNFLKDLVIVCFSQHRSDFDRVQWRPILDAIGDGPTSAQCYFILLAVPPQQVPFALAHTIAQRLKGTRFEQLSASLLEDVHQ